MSAAEPNVSVRRVFTLRFLAALAVLIGVNLVAWWVVRRPDVEPVSENAQSAVDGTDRTEPTQPLHIVSTTASGRIGPETPLRIEFDRDFSVLDFEPGLLARLLRFSPRIEGDVFLDGARALLFKPSAPLPLATSWKMTVSPEVASLFDSALEGPTEYEFSTARLRFRRASQAAFHQDRSAVLDLEFDQPVEPTSLDAALTLEDAEGEPLPWALETSEPSTRVRLRTLQPVDSVRLSLSAGLRGIHGPLGLRAPIERVEVPLTRRLRLKSVSATRVFRQEVKLLLHFNHALRTEFDEIRRLVSIEPSVDFSPLRIHYGTIVLGGAFEPGATYRLTVKKGLYSLDGALLLEDIERRVDVPERARGLDLVSAGTLSPSGNGRLLLESSGVEHVEVCARRVLPNNLVHWLVDGRTRNLTPYVRVSEPVRFAIGSSRNELVESSIAFSDIVPAGEDPRGLWFVEADDVNSRIDDEEVLIVSDLALSLKRSPAACTVWVTGIASGKPVHRAHVSLWTRNAQMRAFAFTDGDGLARLEGPFDPIDGPPFLLLVEHMGDVSYLKLDEGRLSYASFEVGGRRWPGRGYEAFVYCDRGVYRPGDTVRVGALVRDVEVEAPRAFPVEVEVLRPDRGVWKLASGVLDEEGWVRFALPTSVDAITGAYELTLRVPGEDGARLGRTRFLVEEFVPQRVRVSARFLDSDADHPTELAEAEGPVVPTRLTPRQKVSVEVRGEWLAGLPAAGEKVRLHSRLERGRFQPRDPRWAEYAFGSDADVEPREESIGAATLDAEGRAVFEVETPGGLASHPFVWQLIAETNDASGRRVEARLARSVDPQPFYVGVRHRSDARTPAAFWIDCAALRVDGQPMPLSGVDLELSRVVRTWAFKRDSGGRYGRQMNEQLVPVETRQVRLEEGLGSLSLRTEFRGEFRVRIRDVESGMEASTRFWHRAEPWEHDLAAGELERLEIDVLSQRVLPGDSVPLRIRSPFRGTLLLTLEGDDVLSTQVLECDRQLVEVSVDVPEGRRSSLYVSATMVRGLDTEDSIEPESVSGARRAYGVAPIELDFHGDELQVDLRAPPGLEPGDVARIALRVTDTSGSPRRARVQLSLVDEGILAWAGHRTPDPWGWFYSRRGLEVVSADNYSRLAPDVPLELRRLMPGGGRAAGAAPGLAHRSRHLNAIASRRFRTTSIWLDPRETDADGYALFDVEMPDFTGELRVECVAWSGSSFGAARTSMVLRPPLWLELGLPRFLSPGDRCLARTKVFSTLGPADDARVEIVGEGPVEGIEELEELPRVVDPLASLEADAESTGQLAFASSSESDAAERQIDRITLQHELLASPAAGLARLTWTARLGERERRETLELPIRPATAHSTRSRGGQVASDAPLELELPPDEFLEGTRQWTLSVSGRPDLDLLGAIDYLQKYPHGCLEQTTARTLPQIWLPELSALLRSAQRDSEDDTRQVAVGIDRILSMATPAGGLSMWPGGDRPWLWGTLFATHTLVEARRAGYAVPGPALEELLAWIDSDVLRSSRDDRGPLHRAYAAYTLVAGGETDGLASLLSTLARPLDAATDREARWLLAAALAEIGDRDGSRELLEGTARKSLTEIRETGGTLRSPVRELAVELLARLDIDPGDASIPDLVQQLLATRKIAGRRPEDGVKRWRSTQENAFALLALGRYARSVRYEASVGTARVTVFSGASPEADAADNLETFDVSSDGQRSLVLPADARRVRIDVEGDARFFWSSLEAGVPLATPAESMDRGLRARRRLLSATGEPIGERALRWGELVRVELRVESSRSLANVAVVDLLPAGLEVESPRLAPRLEESSARTIVSGHLDVRDDRVIVHVPRLPQGESVWQYAVRAVTPGEFAVAPIFAECLYDESIFSRHGGGRLKIVESDD